MRRSWRSAATRPGWSRITARCCYGTRAAKHGGFLGAGEWLFVAACVVGGCVATVAGYVVGLPSLRLRGDYLAIVTLGFGEILRVILQQTNT